MNYFCIGFVYLRKEENRGVCSGRTFNQHFALKAGLRAVLGSCQLGEGEQSGSTAACAGSWGVFGKPQRLRSHAHGQVMMPSQCPSSPLSVLLFVMAWKPETSRCSTSRFPLEKGFVIWVDQQFNTRARFEYSESTESMRGHLHTALPINKWRSRRGDEFLQVLRF